MAQTEFGTNSSQTVKLWGSLLLKAALKQTQFSLFMGSSGDSIIQRVTDLEKSAGDDIRYDLLTAMTGEGVTGDDRLADNEEPLVYQQDRVKIDQLRNGHAFTRMSQQRTLHDLRKDGQSNLSKWFKNKFDSYMCRCLCGDTTLTHGQTATAPSTNRYVLSGSVAKTGVIATDEASIGSSHQITLADLDFAKELAETVDPMIETTTINGKPYYVVVLHPYSVVDLKLDTAGSSYTTWGEIQMNANKRGLDNPIFSGALGVYNGMILMANNRIYNPTGSVRRNLFLGRQAGVFGLGGAYDKIDTKKFGGDNPLVSWTERSDDFGNVKGVAAGCVFGMNKSVFDSEDYGTIVISSYAASHTTIN